jgi:ABC-type nitrate/sulfonate/bicarbonate transport system permease component
MKQSRLRSSIFRILPVISVVAVFVAWYFVSAHGPISQSLFPGPLTVAEEAAKYPLSQLSIDITTSMLRLIAGFTLATILGIAMGALSGAIPTVRRLLHAPFELLRPIPPLAWIAVAVIWLGLGEASKVFIIFIAAFFPVYVAAFRGVRSVDQRLVEAGQALGVTPRGTFFRVLLPAALPDVATGLRVGWGLAFTALIGAEVIAAKSGLGYMVMNARSMGDIGIIIYGIVLIGLLGWLTDWLFQHFVMHRLLKWHFR